MRIATIDIGTNSVLLLIADTTSQTLVSVSEKMRITRIGQSVDQTGQLHPAAIQRTLDALSEFRAEIHHHNCDKIAAAATSALRDANNQQDFLLPAQQILSVPIEIISGHREAQLVTMAVQSYYGTLPDRSLIFDVGGGSTEFITVHDQQRNQQSLQLGSVRLTEKFIKNDPPQNEAIAAIDQHVTQTLNHYLPNPLPIEFAVGVAGTVTTFAAIQHQLRTYDADAINDKPLTQTAVDEILEQLRTLTVAQRQQVTGLDPKRADVIVAGAVLVRAILRHFQLPSIQVLDRGVRWGLAAEIATLIA